jgi:hypothetical protein
MKMSPAFKKLSAAISPDELQHMLNTMSLYKVYTTLQVSDKLLLKYINEHGLGYKKAFKTINDLPDSVIKEISEEWTNSNITKKALIKKFSISINTLNKILKNVDRDKSSIDKNWLDYHKLVIKLTNVTKRHYNLKSKNGFDLDHKVSIRSGYLQKIPAGLIASIENLEFIPLSDNRSNGITDSITKEQLFKLCKI